MVRVPALVALAATLLFGVVRFERSLASDLPASRTTLKSAVRQVELNGNTFTLPDGFEIELVAGPPLVDRPITAAFDEHGRLYVADSSGSNDKVDKQLAERPHRIVRLEDANGDGRFDKSVVFADKMMFPEGTMWLAGSLYVTAPPSIWKLTDTDGDGVADERIEWFAGKTLTGCANDLHGPYLGPDGFIYWCKGAFAKQTYERVGKTLRVIESLPNDILGKPLPGDTPASSTHKPQSTWSTRASHIFRCRPDGSQLEVVMTGGMDNPVDVIFTPGGERIFTTTFFQHPGGGQRDGLIHAVYGGVYGKVHDVITEHKHTGEIMPVLTHLGAAAPCGLERYRSDAFGSEYKDNLFACCFNMHKVTRHVLEPHDATFRTVDHDFVVSNNIDFHPTDVLENADGSLLIVDTGGWYKLCCPTSQLEKPDILGAIYRVRRREAKVADDPRGHLIAWSALLPERLTPFLRDGRPAVRDRAMDELARRGQSAIPALKNAVRSEHAGQRLEAIWTLARIDARAARDVTRDAVTDTDSTVRQAALASISLWRDAESLPQLMQIVRTGSASNRRVAAEAIGRIGDRSAVPALLEAAADLGGNTRGEPRATHDRFLEHSISYALIEIGDAAATEQGLAATNPWTRRVALIALSEMDLSGLTAATVAPLLSSPEPLIKETAKWVVGRHAEWGDALADHLGGLIRQQDLAEADQAELRRQLAHFARQPAIQRLLAAIACEENSVGRRIAVEAMRDAGLREKEVPAPWIDAITAALREDSLLTVAISAARAVPVAKDKAGALAAALRSVAERHDVQTPTRLDALAAIPGGLESVPPDVFEFLRSHLTADHSVSERAAAADVLSKSKLNSEQLVQLAESLETAGPLELDRLVAPFASCSDDAVGGQLVASLKRSSSLSAIRPDSLRASLAKFGPPVHEQAQELFAAMKIDLAKQKDRLEELLGSLSSGDIRRGQAVFMGQKAACSSCHAMGYLGGKVGPDLTRIGGIRTERDLLESIVFPSASFVRSYEPMLIATRDGKIHNGIVRKDAPDELVLATTATEEVRIAREDIEEVRPGVTSVMPSGLDQQLSKQELADLIAFLKAAK